MPDGCCYPETRKYPSNFMQFNLLSLAVACLQGGVLIYCDRDFFFHVLLIHTVFSIKTNTHSNRTVILKGKLISAWNLTWINLIGGYRIAVWMKQSRRLEYSNQFHHRCNKITFSLIIFHGLDFVFHDMGKWHALSRFSKWQATGEIHLLKHIPWLSK